MIKPLSRVCCGIEGIDMRSHKPVYSFKNYLGKQDDVFIPKTRVRNRFASIKIGERIIPAYEIRIVKSISRMNKLMRNSISSRGREKKILFGISSRY